MLQRTQQDVAYCHERAEQARRMAENETDPVRRQEYTDMEMRWINLAMSYEFADRLNSYTNEVTRRMDKLRRP